MFVLAKFKKGIFKGKNTSFMITKKELKEINLLGTKKGRKIHQRFVVEGKKSVAEFMAEGFQQKALYSIASAPYDGADLVTEKEMQKMSFLKSASPLLAVFTIPQHKSLPLKGRILVLDQVADPGNLGTIIRICDWFGIKHIIGSLDTVDCYNPKVVQASMGSLARVECHYIDLEAFFTSDQRPVYGTYLEGTSVYNAKLPEDAILVMGSEANGISNKVGSFIDHKITIPRKSSNGPESLNVAIATALILGHISQ